MVMLLLFISNLIAVFLLAAFILDPNFMLLCAGYSSNKKFLNENQDGVLFCFVLFCFLVLSCGWQDLKFPQLRIEPMCLLH